eukprot:TRINITY_DN21637_c0_g1_i1.p1 TRINITY_DN21637_c0_g1~~TRINITY_DN21637_c0_g1_i1.p1  ORF type:complete len:301 (-),score=58.59 TRINITY_DN21637_c0_g1_i1:823-1725(-)
MNDQSKMMNQSQMMNRNFSLWPPPEDQMAFRPGFSLPKPGRGKWKGKKAAEKRRNEKSAGAASAPAGGGGGGVGSSGYKPPTLHELQFQNRMKARRFYPKKKFNRFAAPRNTTSFIIRAKKSGGIASLISPSPVTPAVLPTPIFSPSREVLGDMAKEEWGVDGYGTMNGFIRLRSSGHENRDEEDEEDGSSESDVEEHVEVERRLDHDLSRFEMIYPNFGDEHAHLLENRVDDQDSHIAQLEEENLTLKERLFLMEREMVDLRRRLQCLETENCAREENADEGSENEGGGDVCSEKSAGD